MAISDDGRMSSPLWDSSSFSRKLEASEASGPQAPTYAIASGLCQTGQTYGPVLLYRLDGPDVFFDLFAEAGDAGVLFDLFSEQGDCFLRPGSGRRQPPGRSQSRGSGRVLKQLGQRSERRSPGGAAPADGLGGDGSDHLVLVVEQSGEQGRGLLAFGLDRSVAHRNPKR
jgi:hypothetical protein